MNILETSEYLVYEELYVFVGECLLSNDVVEITAHELGDKVDILEVVKGSGWCEHIQQTNHLSERKREEGGR